MEAKLIKTKTGFYLWRNPLDKSQEILGATVPIMNDNNVDLREHKLSIKNCQTIELGYDLDELEQLAQKDIHNLKPINPHPTSFFAGYRRGFQKALEILGDKKFSEDDVNLAFVLGKNKDESRINKLINSRLQQTEWDVEVEMENKPYKYLVTIGEVTTSKLEPKLDANGCIILKRK